MLRRVRDSVEIASRPIITGLAGIAIAAASAIICVVALHAAIIGVVALRAALAKRSVAELKFRSEGAKHDLGAIALLVEVSVHEPLTSAPSTRPALQFAILSVRFKMGEMVMTKMIPDMGNVSVPNGEGGGHFGDAFFSGVGLFGIAFVPANMVRAVPVIAAEFSRHSGGGDVTP